MTASYAKKLCSGGSDSKTHNAFPTSKGTYLKLKARALSSMMNLHVDNACNGKLRGLLREGDILFNCN